MVHTSKSATQVAREAASERYETFYAPMLATMVTTCDAAYDEYVMQCAREVEYLASTIPAKRTRMQVEDVLASIAHRIAVVLRSQVFHFYYDEAKCIVNGEVLLSDALAMQARHAAHKVERDAHEHARHERVRAALAGGTPDYETLALAAGYITENTTSHAAFASLSTSEQERMYSDWCQQARDDDAPMA